MGKTAHLLNVALGLWLIISASLWPHSPPQFVTTWVLGALCAAAAALAAVKPPVRYMNTIFSVLLSTTPFVRQFEIPPARVQKIGVLVSLPIYSGSEGPAPLLLRLQSAGFWHVVRLNGLALEEAQRSHLGAMAEKDAMVPVCLSEPERTNVQYCG